MELPSAQELDEFIRRWARISATKTINDDTTLERDLGITGDDGEELILALEKHFDITLTRESFDLQPNEDLFGAEASLTLFSTLIFAFRERRIIRPITVTELCEVIRTQMKRAKAQ